MFKKKNTALLTALLMTAISINVLAGKGSFEPSPSTTPQPTTPPLPIPPSFPAENDPNNPYYDLEEMDETNKKQTKLLQLLAGGGSALATAVGGLGMFALQTVVSNKTKDALDKKSLSSSAFFPNNSKKIADKEMFLEGISHQLENNKKDSKAVLYSSEPDKAGLFNDKNKKAEAHANRLARESELLNHLEQEVAKEKVRQFKLSGEALLEAHKKAKQIIENDPIPNEDLVNIETEKDVNNQEPNHAQKVNNIQAESINQIKAQMIDLNKQAVVHNRLESYYLSVAEGNPNHKLLEHPEVHKAVKEGKKEFLDAVIHTPSVYKHLAPKTKNNLHQEVNTIRRNLAEHINAPTRENVR